jgi:hypothetical protein
MSGPNRDPLTVIAELARAYEANVVRRERQGLLLDIALRRVDGRCVPYRVLVGASGACLIAREETPLRLPPFCPERHINFDGTFCMDWHPGDVMEVVNAESAGRWLATLLQFLRHQERARRLRRWPDRHAWAHGGAAAHHQRAEDFASRLGQQFIRDLRNGRLEVVRWRKGMSANGPSLRFYRDGQRIYSVWERYERVIGLRRPCVCSHSGNRRRLPIRSCGDHAQAAAGLALALQNWKLEEERFWREMKGIVCCDTIDECRLRPPA